MSQEIPPLPARDERTHKGQFGTIAVIGGSFKEPYVMYGGTVLSALSALRTGAGKCTLVMPESLLQSGIESVPQAIGVALPQAGKDLKSKESLEAISSLKDKADCFVVGPALGSGKTQPKMVKELLSQNRPVVVDAGAINAIAYNDNVWSDNPNTVLTPHVKEFERLAAKFGIDTGGDSKDQADKLALKLKTVVVYKSSFTLVTDGKNRFILDKPNPVLAAAGSGDILAGIIGGLATQYYPKGLSLFECSVLGVAIHSKAGQLWSERRGDRGIIMQELVDLIPEAIKNLD